MVLSQNTYLEQNHRKGSKVPEVFWNLWLGHLLVASVAEINAREREIGKVIKIFNKIVIPSYSGDISIVHCTVSLLLFQLSIWSCDCTFSHLGLHRTVRCMLITCTVYILLIQLYNPLCYYSPVTSPLSAVHITSLTEQASNVSIGDEQETIEAKPAENPEETIWNSFKLPTDSVKLEHLTIASVAYNFRTLDKNLLWLKTRQLDW